MTNYQKGYRFEREIMEILKKDFGAVAVARTSGSHGFFDVMAIVPHIQLREDPLNLNFTGSLYLIQAKSCKSKKPTKAHEKEFEKMKLIQLPRIVEVKKEFWIRFPGGHKIAWGEKR